ncbi:hypothetical protein [Microbacterium karelineae]|uniref:hypothetical protein n=1 Tax=Microbacterium karelineae TaxID=2654283 RepID=UPI0012EA0FC7|nr:hypothetical protein [Microbacterium karelineae]
MSATSSTGDPQFGAGAARGVVIGGETGHTRLRTPSAKPPLGPGGWPLPQLTARQQRPRAWWRHPALLVSTILTVLALLGMTAWMIVSSILSSDVVVSDISIELDGGNARVDWSGPDAAYNLYAVDGDGAVTDLTQFVLASTDAWLPSATGTWTDTTCFVVRSAEHVELPVTLGAAELAAQGAQSTCIADAGS